MPREQKKGSLVDPVADGQSEAAGQESEIRAMSIDGLNLDDFQPVPVTAARAPHPFEGYPQQKIQIGTWVDRGKEKPLVVSKTALVALNPKEYVHQDPSGNRVSSVVGGQETFVDYKTLHARVVRDQNGRSIEVIFSREINLGDGRKITRCAYCPDHTARAQIIFGVDKKTGKITVDRRYVLADVEQVGRLRRLFEMYHYQQTQSERLAQKFDNEQESAAQ
ncbi:MAG TPA: hypothetical protein VLH56_17275 [Dissulfurispiraceae bacterium]|nr:hypothetical protein [Dissulfurispiraceae bacterium]